MPRRTDVFISYASRDRELAEQLARVLAARGWSVWWDRQIVAGQTFDRVIEHELETARCVVVLWSSASVASEWVRNEAASATERGVLVPATIDRTRPPLQFRRQQTASLVGWTGEETHEGFKALCTGIVGLIGGSQSSNPVAPARLLPSRRRRMVWGGIIAAVLGTALAGWMISTLLQDPLAREAALVRAAEDGETAAMRRLLRQGVSLNRVGAEALCGAADARYDGEQSHVKEQAQLETITCLLDQGVSPNVRGEEGMTPLILLVRGTSESLGAVQVLLKRGADVDAKCDCSVCDPRSGSRGCTALMVAATRGHVAITKELLNHGADVNARTDRDRTALMLAEAPDIVPLLLEQGADVNAADMDGTTVLMWSVKKWGYGVTDHAAEVTLDLLRRGARVDAVDREGRTALICAAVVGWEEIARELLRNGADLNAKTSRGRTALMFAVLNGHPDVVRLLINQRALPDEVDVTGQTALELAKERLKGETRDEIVHLLEGDGAK